MFSYKDSNHQVVGPLPADAIRQLIAGGAIGRNSLLRAEGSDFWQPAAKFPEFREFLDRIHGAVTAAENKSADHATGDTIEVNAEVVTEPPAQQPATSTTEAPPPLTDNAAAGASDADSYFMIGGDGREYGPVTAAQLREWIGQGRANRDTRVRRSTEATHVPLGSLAAFSDIPGPASGSATAQPPPPPTTDGRAADQLADEILDRGYNLSLTHCFRRSWKLYTENFWLLTAASAVVLIVTSLLHLIPTVGNVAAIALGGVFSAGLGTVFLKRIRGQVADVADVGVGFQRSFAQLLLGSVVVFVLVVIGILPCALPAIYLSVGWLFTYQLIFERSLDFWPAMELSRRVVHERWWEFFALVVCGFLLSLVGFLTVVGIFLTTPITFGALMYAYEDVFGGFRATAGDSSDQRAQTPPDSGAAPKETLV